MSEKKLKSLKEVMTADVNVHDGAISAILNENMGHVNHDLQALKISRDNYNRFQVPLINSWTKVGYGHVFFTMPACNLFKNKSLSDDAGNLLMSEDFTKSSIGSIKIDFEKIKDISPYLASDALSKAPELYNRLKDSPDLYRYLDSSVDGTPFMVPLYNHAKRAGYQDANLRTSSSAKNSRGISTEYGVDILESMANSQVSFTFHDDDNMIVFNLIDFWVKYIEAVRFGKVTPKFDYITQEKLDYTCSIYVFILGDDAQTIKYFCRYTGCYPMVVPYSSYEYSKRGDTQPEHNVTFKVTKFEPMNPVILNEFNKIASEYGGIDTAENMMETLGIKSANPNNMTDRILGNWEEYHNRTYSWYYPTDVCVIKDPIKKWTDDNGNVFSEGSNYGYKLMFYNRQVGIDSSKLNMFSSVLQGLENDMKGKIGDVKRDLSSNIPSYFKYSELSK
ncbi:MAG: hypothetical protein ACRC92_04085 [Peptostreptococcaceae bacterium]